MFVERNIVRSPRTFAIRARYSRVGSREIETVILRLLAERAEERLERIDTAAQLARQLAVVVNSPSLAQALPRPIYR